MTYRATAHGGGVAAVWIGERIIEPGSGIVPHWEIWHGETHQTLATYPDAGQTAERVLAVYRGDVARRRGAALMALDAPFSVAEYGRFLRDTRFWGELLECGEGE